MGERKGVNKYYPPDYDPRKGGLNKFQGTHALRERARKLHEGILIIRFEMPYNIWCDGCENHIGTGVRYNAEKKKVGMYYSTPIYQFRMKCHLCVNHFEIKTDPANLDYVIISGARRQERRWDPDENEQIAPEDKEVSRKMATDAMYKLEHGVADKEKKGEIDPALKHLEEFQESRWKDDYAANQNLREIMRGDRNKRKEQSVKDASYNLSVPLLPPNEEDAEHAKILQFTNMQSSEDKIKEKRSIIEAQSVFSKMKQKRLSPATKKEIARQSISNIVSSKQKDFVTFKANFNSLDIGIKKLKPNPSTNKDPKRNVNNCNHQIFKDLDDAVHHKLIEEEEEENNKSKPSTSNIDVLNLNSHNHDNNSKDNSLNNNGINGLSLVSSYSSSSDTD